MSVGQNQYCLANHTSYQAGRRNSPTAGSFVRPSRSVDPPVGFLEALHNKYASESSKSTALHPRGENSDKPIKISGKVVEEVGFEKIREQLARLQELQIVLLDGLCIAGVLSDATAQQEVRWLQELELIEETCPKITELDLSKNLIESWAEVEGLCTALPNLISLKIKCVHIEPLSILDLRLLNDASGNRFKEKALPEDVSSRVLPSRSPYQGIIELGLDDTLLPWENVSLSNHLRWQLQDN